MKKKLLSVLLCLCMVMALLPTTALAANGDGMNQTTSHAGAMELKMDGGYDIGHLDVTGEEGSVSFTFWNEYMLAEQDGQRAATFPDLICTLDAATGEAISTAESKDGMDAYAIEIPKEKLIMRAGMHQRELFQEVEDLLHKDMVACNDGLFV